MIPQTCLSAFSPISAPQLALLTLTLSPLFSPFLSHLRNDFAALPCPEPFHCLEMVPGAEGMGQEQNPFLGFIEAMGLFSLSFSSTK